MGRDDVSNDSTRLAECNSDTSKKKPHNKNEFSALPDIDACRWLPINLVAMLIREEKPGDADAVYTVVSGAFGRSAEAQLVRDLHAAGDAVIALVAEDKGYIVGHVLLSRMTAPFPALAVAPVSVAPAKQGTGIGSALVRGALRRAAEGPWRGIFVLGEPHYYARFGFTAAAATGFSSPYAGDHFMGLALSGPMPATTGKLVHPRAFSLL